MSHLANNLTTAAAQQKRLSNQFAGTGATPDDISIKTSDQPQTKEGMKPEKEKLDTNTLMKVVNKALSLFDRLLIKFGA